MGKRALFASLVIAIVTGASVLAGGCSAAVGAGIDAGFSFDSGNKTTTDGSGAIACLTDSTSFGTGGAATQTLNACSQTEIATLDSVINGASGTTYLALYGMVGASCQKCLFSNAADANWQYFVFVPDMQTVLQDVDAGTAGSTVFDNSVGACVAHAPAGGSSCSLATTHNDECYQSSCESCAAQADYDACENATQTAAQCSPNDTRSTDCTTKAQYDQALIECGFDLSAGTIDFKTLFNVTCGTGVASDGGTGATEGGTDAGPG